jgi:hypothetical protein
MQVLHLRGGKTQLSFHITECHAFHITECHALLPSSGKRKLVRTDIADIPDEYDHCGEKPDCPIIDGRSIEEMDSTGHHTGKKSDPEEFTEHVAYRSDSRK